MSEFRRRWYAPVQKGWRGKPISRRRALAGGALMAVAATGWLFAAALDDDRSGPIGETMDWVLVALWGTLAYLGFAHAAFNTTREPERPEGGS